MKICCPLSVYAFCTSLYLTTCRLLKLNSPKALNGFRSK